MIIPSGLFIRSNFVLKFFKSSRFDKPISQRIICLLSTIVSLKLSVITIFGI